jgi:hypothetical protein
MGHEEWESPEHLVFRRLSNELNAANRSLLFPDIAGVV